MEEALGNAEEAILCHIEGIIEDGEPLSHPRPIEEYKKKKAFKQATWALVSVNLEKLSGKAKRLNITMPERILSQIDDFAAKAGESRSGFLAKAALEYIHEHSVEST